jgi:hypothetical protein
VHCFVATRTNATAPRWRWVVTLTLFLALGLLISAQDADARLKSEWKFSGSLAHTFASSSSFASVILGDTVLDDSLPVYAAQPTYPGGSLEGLFSRPGLIGGFAAGFLGAGILGLAFGHGMIGEVSSAASAFGLIFQLVFFVAMIRLIWSWCQADKAASFAALSPRQLADAYGRSRNEVLPDIEPVTDIDDTASDAVT